MHAGINFTRFLDWKKLVREVADLKNFIRKYRGVNTTEIVNTNIILETEHFINQMI